MATGMGVLTPPEFNHSLTVYQDAIMLNWDPAGDDTVYYQILRGVTNDIDDAEVISGWVRNVNSYVDYNVTDNQIYYYWGRSAYDTVSLVSPYSDALTAWLEITAPVHVNASKGEFEAYVRVRWSLVNPDFYYKVYRSTQPYYNYSSPVTSWISDTSLVDSSTYEGIRYYYWVKTALTGEGEYSSDYSELDTGYVTNTTLNKEQQQTSRYQLYPNPAGEKVNLKVPPEAQGPVSLVLMDMAGAEVFEVRINDWGNIELDLSDLKPGAYIVETRAGDGDRFRQLLIVR
jgi:hypothetical protein